MTVKIIWLLFLRGRGGGGGGGGGGRVSYLGIVALQKMAYCTYLFEDSVTKI